MNENTNTEIVEDRELEAVNGGFNWNLNSGLHHGHLRREAMSVNGIWYELAHPDAVDIGLT